jgi:hypothetical protein
VTDTCAVRLNVLIHFYPVDLKHVAFYENKLDFFIGRFSHFIRNYIQKFKRLVNSLKRGACNFVT